MLSSVLWIALSRIVLGLTPLLTLPALTEGLSPEWYGVWAQIATTLSFVVPLVGMGLDTAVIRYFATGFADEKRVRDFYSMGVFLAAIALGFLAIAAVGSRFLGSLMFSKPDLATYSVLAFIWVLIQGIYNYAISFFRVTGRMRTYAVLDAANGLTAAFVMVFIPLRYHSVALMLEGLMAGHAMFALAFLLFIYRQLGFSGISFKGIGKYLKYGLPLVPNSLFLWLVNSSGRYFLTHYRGLAEVGVYAAGFTIANVMTLFFMPISFVLFPVISKLWEEGRKDKVAAMVALANQWYLILAIPGALGLSFLAEPIVGLLSAKEFSGGVEVIFWLALANLFYGLYQINLYGTLLLQKNIRLTGLFALAGILNVGLNLALIPTLGNQGAAIGMLISFLFLAGMVFLWARRALGFHRDWAVNFKVLLSALMMLAALWLWRSRYPIKGALTLAGTIMLAAVVYALLLLASRAVRIDDLKNISKK